MQYVIEIICSGRIKYAHSVSPRLSVPCFVKNTFLCISRIWFQSVYENENVYPIFVET